LSSRGLGSGFGRELERLVAALDGLRRRLARLRTTVGIAVREHVEVRIRLGDVPDRPGADVAEAVRHPARDERREPGEEGDREEQELERERDEERRDGEE